MGFGNGNGDSTLLVGFAGKIVYIRQPKAESDRKCRHLTLVWEICHEAV